MTVAFNVRADVKEVRRYLSSLGPGVNRAAARAINKTARPVIAEAAREIKKKRNLRIGLIKKAMQLIRARANSLVATITPSGRPIAMRHFGARTTRQGVSVKVAERRVRLRRFGNKSFIIAKFGNNVFVRKGKARLPIVEWPRVPGIPHVFNQAKVLDAMTQAANRAWPKRFREELNFEFRKLSRKARRR